MSKPPPTPLSNRLMPALQARGQLIAGSFMAALLALLGVVAIIVFQAENAQDEVRQSIEARNAAEALISSIREAELQQRNVIISDEPDHRSRLEEALDRIPVEFSRLLAESDEPAQRERLRDLERMVAARTAEIEGVVESLAQAGPSAASATLKANEQRGTMAAIADLIREFDAEEDRIQSVREHRDTQLRLWLVPALALAALSALGLGFVWLKQERSLAAALREVNRQLESLVLERTAALENERRRVETLLADMTHRIGNSLSMVSAFLALEARRSKDANVREALNEANRRVAAIASAQRRLRIASDRDEVALEKYLGDLVQDLRATLVGEHVSVRIAANPVTVESHDAVAVGIILNELVTNAVKHAFPDGEDGQILVHLENEGVNCCLRVADDGVGLQHASGGDESLGMLVIRNMVTSVQGTLTCAPRRPGADRPGTEWRLSFAAQPLPRSAASG